MISALFISPITGRKVFEWKEKLEKGDLLVREIIDIDSTYVDSEAEIESQSIEKNKSNENKRSSGKTDKPDKETKESESGDNNEYSEEDEFNLSLAKMEEEIKILLIPKDPNDHRNVIVEIRAGTGGEEASLFAAELFRMYSRHAEKSSWKVELLSQSATGLKGFKEVVFLIEGEDAYSKLKFEGGTHRVQRVPTTETSGRIHTSAVTVAVLPEAEEVDIKIDQNDLRIDTFRSSGPGGQSVNTTDSAIRITHLPTNLVVSCQDEKSQHKNKAKAMKILRSRLLEITKSEQDAERAETRRTMVGSGDRSEKIRTYNFPQGRVTDHRINHTSHNLEGILAGAVEEFTEELQKAEMAQRLAESGLKSD